MTRMKQFMRGLKSARGISATTPDREEGAARSASAKKIASQDVRNRSALREEKNGPQELCIIYRATKKQDDAVRIVVFKARGAKNTARYTI